MLINNGSIWLHANAVGHTLAAAIDDTAMAAAGF